MGNAIELFGYVFKPIHIQLIQLGFVILASGGILGIILRKMKTMWAERGNRQLDHHLATITEVSDIDDRGYRTMRISNLGRPDRLENVIRGRHERAWMLAAARNCTWDRRFIKDSNPKHQARIIHVVRNALTEHFKDGEAAHLAGLPTKEIDLYFSSTGADAAVGGVLMFRDMVVTRKTLRTVLDHPENMWRFEVDKVTGDEQDHKVRVKTLREMAEALFDKQGCRQLDGQMVRIVGWMRARVRA